MTTMTTTPRETRARIPTPPVLEERQVMDYVRVLYKRRWIAIPVFAILFVVGTVNALRQTPVYQAHVQLLIESDTPKVARLDQMFQTENGYDDEFRQTQFRILQSRTLAKRTIDAMKLWGAPRLGNGPEPKASISFVGMAWSAVFTVLDWVQRPFAGDDKPQQSPDIAPSAVEAAAQKAETSKQSARIDEFLGGVSVSPVRNSRIVEVRYASTDPNFAADAANAVVRAYIQQNMESKFTTSKDAADFLSEKLAEQRKALEGERIGAAGLQGEERHGIGGRQRVQHRRAAADGPQRCAHEGEDGSHQQRGAVQPAQVGRGLRRARYLPGGHLERVHPEAQG